LEKAELIEILEGVIDTLRSTLPANHELVLHDLSRPESSVIKIINGHVSGRDLHASLLMGPEDDQGFVGLLRQPEPNQKSHLIANYPTLASNGKVLQSTSMIYYSETGQPNIAFCINVDNEPLELLDRLRALLSPADTHPPLQVSDTLLAEHAIDAINGIIARHKSPNRKLTKEQRRNAVLEAHEQGIFKLRGGLVTLAEVMKVSRFTIYNDLEALNIKQ
jgi:predicted transcriptional regulator YheO